MAFSSHVLCATLVIKHDLTVTRRTEKTMCQAASSDTKGVCLPSESLVHSRRHQRYFHVIVRKACRIKPSMRSPGCPSSYTAASVMAGRAVLIEDCLSKSELPENAVLVEDCERKLLLQGTSGTER